MIAPCGRVTTRPNLGEWNLTRPVAIALEVRSESSTDNLGHGRLAAPRFALKPTAYLVGQTYGCALHTRIIATSRHLECPRAEAVR
jgi:hypothetical protein